jgi:feruloyl-CoA synthase
MSEGWRNAPLRPPRFVQPPIVVERSANGSIHLRCDIAVTPKYAHVPDLLRQRAKQFPTRPMIAQRASDDRWLSISYAALEERSNRVASYLLANGSGPHTPLLILSGNSIAHAVMLLAAMKARVPVAPVSVAYSLMDKDFTRLRQVAAITRAGWVFADDAAKFAPAFRAIAHDGMRFISSADLDSIDAQPISTDLEASIAAIAADTVAKYMFTSGSTGTPKAVVHTHGMLRAQIASVDAVRQTHDDTHAPIALNWMPWSHVSAGNMSFHENLLEAGTLYLDDGKPVEGLFGETLRNLKEVSPTLYGCAPIGYAWLADALEKDAALRQSFFKNLKSMIYGGAALPRAIYERMQALAVAHTGYRIPFMSVYGSTESSGATLTYQENIASGMIGLPAPGVEIKLVPRGDTFAVCVRGASVFKEYLGQPELTAAAFDLEGFFHMGDAAKLLDDRAPEKGLVFDGRISEDFKLTSGTWVATGNVRLNLLSAVSKLLSDVVICGENRPYLTAMAWLNFSAARELLAASTAQFSDEELLQTPLIADAIARSIAHYNVTYPGTSTRIQRLLLLDAPPSSDETSEKGSINQRLVISRRSREVERLYGDPADARVIELIS